LSSPVGHGGADEARARLHAFIQVLPVAEAVEPPNGLEQNLLGGRP
jgi:hypothetical protein